MIPDCTRCGHGAGRHMDDQHEVGHCREETCACAQYTAAEVEHLEQSERVVVILGVPNGLVIDGVPQYVMREVETTAEALAKAITTLEEA